MEAARARSGAMLEDLRRHVAMPTGGQNASAIEESRVVFGRRLAALGATLSRVKGDPRPDWLFEGEDAAAVPAAPPETMIASRLGGQGRARILLSGHLDTVHDPAGAFRELSVSSDGRTATGPGCADMKGGLIVAVTALEILEECGVGCSWSFIMNADEETGSFSSDAALRAAAKDHDVGLVFEPALPDGSLVVRRPGSGQFTIECRGRSAHVGRDFTSGVSAVTALAERLVAVASWPDPARGLIVSVGPVRGGRTTNSVPDSASAWGNVRYPDPAMIAELEARYASITTAPDAMPACDVRATFNRPAKPTTPAVEKLAMLARGAAEDLGQSLPFGVTGGVCDGNNLQAAGLPVIDTLGVRGGGLHTTSEWVDLASLTERAALAAVLIARLAGGAMTP